MALPGLSLPGLGQSSQNSVHAASIPALSSTQPLRTRTEDLTPRTEWRFEVAFTQTYTIRLISGHAEIFGIELAPNQTYTFTGAKAAVFTWHGCQLEIAGEAESEYLGSETEYAVEWLNVHGMLETARDDAQGPQQADGGPRVMVVGPDHVGKSSLVQSLSAWAVKSRRSPLIINADPRQGLLAPPGSLTAFAGGSSMDVENGYGITPISGQTVAPVKNSLVYHFPFGSPSERPEVYKGVTTRMAVSVTSKLEEDAETKKSGVLLDTPGSLNDPKSNYEILAHLVSEFSITCILTMGSERLYNDLNRRFGPTTQEPIPVLRISKPGGATERDATFMKHTLSRQIRQYFYGTPKEPLNPHSQTHPFAQLAIYRANSTTSASAANPSASTAPGMDYDDDEYDPYSSKPTGSNGSSTFERITPDMSILNGVLAIKFCPANSDEATIRDSAVLGFLFVAEVDEGKQRVRFLAPGPHRWGDRALVWGPWPEAMGEGIGT